MIEFILENPVLNITLAVLSIYALVLHLKSGHGIGSNLGLAGLAGYLTIDAVAHILPVIQGATALTSMRPSAIIGLVIVVLLGLAYVFFRTPKDEKEDAAKSVAGYGLLHSAYHVVIAGRALIGASGQVHGPEVTGALAGFVTFVYNPYFQLAIALLSGFVLYKELRH
jgi:hypothetical protein